MISSVAPFTSAPDYPDYPGTQGPRLLADVGGTNARFAIERSAGRIESVQVLACADHPGLAHAVRAYLAAAPGALADAVKHGAIAIANPVLGDFIQMTNHHWQFSIVQLRQELNFDTLVMVNDFSALAMALPHLAAGDKRQVGGGAAVAGAAIGLLGAGTGLGVSGLVPAADTKAGVRWTALRSEGGHATFCPANQTELSILQFAWRHFAHVSTERFLSGAGIELIYAALCHLRGIEAGRLSAADISRRALSGLCTLCDEVIEIFCGMLGTAAGNLAVTLGAQGGVYIGGGIVPLLGERFDRSCFRARFEQKGRFDAYLGAIPTYVITASYPAFIGASALLTEQIGAH